MTNNKMTAVYCRLALKDDVIIEAQKEQVMQYAAEQGYGNISLYVDNGASGSDFNRLAFTEMNADIEAGKVGTVLVRSICRIGRNIAIMNWIDGLRRKGIAVKAADGSCDDIGSMIELVRNINKYKVRGCD